MKTTTQNRSRNASKTLVFGIFLIILAIILYGIHEYFLPQYDAFKRAEQQQDVLWLTAFKSLNLTAKQKDQIKDLLQEFDKDKRLSQISMVRDQDALRRTVQSDADHKEKLQQANEKIKSLFEAMIELKQSDFYHLRKVYFNILTVEQRVKFSHENPVSFQPKPMIAKKMKAQVPQAFEDLDLSDEQKKQILKIIDLPKLVDIAYQREMTNFQIHTQQFLKEVDDKKVDALFAALLQEYIVAYNLHKEQYEKIYTQVLTDEQRKGLSQPKGDK